MYNYDLKVPQQKVKILFNTHTLSSVLNIVTIISVEKLNLFNFQIYFE